MECFCTLAQAEGQSAYTYYYGEVNGMPYDAKMCEAYIAGQTLLGYESTITAVVILVFSIIIQAKVRNLIKLQKQ